MRVLPDMSSSLGGPGSPAPGRSEHDSNGLMGRDWASWTVLASLGSRLEDAEGLPQLG